MTIIQEFKMRLRVLKMLKVQKILLKEMEKQLNDYDNGICEKVDKTPITIAEAITPYRDRLENMYNRVKK